MLLPLNNMDLNFMSLLIRGFFPINIQLALCIPGFHICRFNQPQIENSILESTDRE